MSESISSTPNNQLLLDDLLKSIEEQDIIDYGINDSSSFEIIDRKQANRFVESYLRMKAENEETKKIAAEELERRKKQIEDWADKKINDNLRSMEWMEGLLMAFAKKELEGTSKRSVPLIAGKLQFRKTSPEYVYDKDNKQKVIDFLKAHEDTSKIVSSKTTEDYDKNALKKLCQIKDGKLYLGDEVVPAISVTERQEEFKVG